MSHVWGGVIPMQQGRLGSWVARKQLCRKRSDCSGWQQVGRRSAGCLCNKGHLQAGVSWQKHSCQVKESDFSPLFGIWDHIWNTVYGFGLPGTRKTWTNQSGVQQRATKLAPGSWSDGQGEARELGLLSVRKRWLFTAPRWGTWGRQSWTLLGAAQVSSRRQDCRCAHFHYRHWGSRGTALLSVCPLSFPTYVLAMPASGKTGIVFIACPLEDGRASPFLLLLSMVLLIL